MHSQIFCSYFQHKMIILEFKSKKIEDGELSLSLFKQFHSSHKLIFFYSTAQSASEKLPPLRRRRRLLQRQRPPPRTLLMTRSKSWGGVCAQRRG